MRNLLAITLPMYADKVKVQKHLGQKAGQRETFMYTSFLNGAFLDWGLKVGFPLGEEMYDGGGRQFSTTCTSTIGKPVVGVLQHPETRNVYVHVHEVVVTQKQPAQLTGTDV
jgi:hypothetical protein